MNILAQIILLCVAFVWGTTFTVVKDAISRIDVFIFLFQRFTLAFILFIPPLIYLRKYFTISVLKDGTILGLLLFSAYAFQTIGLKYTTASNAAFITGMNVVFVPLINTLIFKKSVAIGAKIGSILAFTGLGLLCLGDKLSLNIGDAIVILCAIAVALHIIYTDRVTSHHNPIYLTAIQMLVISILSAIVVLFRGKAQAMFILVPNTLGALILCAIFASNFAFWAQTYFQRFISPTKTAIIFSAEPLFGALYARFFGGEYLGCMGIIGGGLILMGMIVSEVHPSRK